MCSAVQSAVQPAAPEGGELSSPGVRGEVEQWRQPRRAKGASLSSVRGCPGAAGAIGSVTRELLSPAALRLRLPLQVTPS